MRFFKYITDRHFHELLVSIIIVLFGLVIYLQFIDKPVDQYQNDLLSKIKDFDLERSLQQVPESPKIGSRQVPILVYHSVRPHTAFQTAMQKYYDVDPGEFEKQLQYLKDHNYVVISLDYLAQALEENISLPSKSVVITFDDGWRNQYAYAFPLLLKFKYTATFFIFTNSIDEGAFLTWDEVRLMNSSGMTIGGHTETHPYLPDIKNLDELKEEIIGGKRIIEDQIGQKIYSFAYPFGHYTDEIINVVKEAGYKTARSTYKGINHVYGDTYKLKSIEVTDDFDQFVSNINY